MLFFHFVAYYFLIKKYIHVYHQNCVSFQDTPGSNGIKDIGKNQSFDSKMEEMNRIHQSYIHYDLIQEYQELLKRNKMCHPIHLENKNDFIKTPSENFHSLYNSWKNEL